MNEYEITDEELAIQRATQEIVGSINDVIDHLGIIRTGLLDGTLHPGSALDDIDRLGDSLHMIRSNADPDEEF